MRVAKVRAWCWALEYVPYACHFPLICVPILCEFLDCLYKSWMSMQKTKQIMLKQSWKCSVSGGGMTVLFHVELYTAHVWGWIWKACALSVEIHLIKMEAWKRKSGNERGNKSKKRAKWAWGKGKMKQLGIRPRIKEERQNKEFINVIWEREREREREKYQWTRNY